MLKSTVPRAKRTTKRASAAHKTPKRHVTTAKRTSPVRRALGRRSMSQQSQSSSAYFDEKNELDRVKGEFSTFYRNAVFTKVLTDMVESGGPVTVFNITGGNVAHQLKESHLHKDAMYLYKWLRLPIGLRRIPEGIGSLKPWLKQFAYANEDVPVDALGFPKDLYLPGTDFIASRILRPQDKLRIFETKQEMIDLLDLAFGEDPRVTVDTSGLHKEADLKALLPCYGRALVFVDLHESTTFQQQKRARNALLGFLKRMPHATFVITYPLHGENMPFEFIDAFARTGMQSGYGTTQWADQLATERNVVTSILEDSVPSNEFAVQQHMAGHRGRVLFNTWTPANPGDHYMLPRSIAATRPRTFWNGAGALVFNAGNDYNHTLQNIGVSLRMALGKPAGLCYGLSGPLYEPQSYELGQSWGHAHSFSHPGIALPEDFHYLNMDEIQEHLDLKFIDELMDKMEYVPMKGGPTNLYEIGKEQSRLTPQGKRLVESKQYHIPSKVQLFKQTPLGVYNKVVTYARQQDLEEYRESQAKVYHEETGLHLNSLPHRYAENGYENSKGFLTGVDRYKPTMYEMQE